MTERRVAPARWWPRSGRRRSRAPAGGVDPASIDRLCAQVAELRALGHSVVLVSSGAIAAGWSAMGGGPRPTDPATLQAVSAVGQSKLMRVYDEAFAARGLAVGQVLLAPLDFIHRQQYLHARQTLSRLLELGVVPVVNENDATSDDEIRFGDNDRLAGSGGPSGRRRPARPAHRHRRPAHRRSPDHGRGVAHRGGGRGRPRARGRGGGAGSAVGSGGMASKLAAAKIAAWSGVETVIADAGRAGVLRGAVDGCARGGHRLPAPGPAPAGPEAVDRLRRRRRGDARGRRGGSPGADGARGVAAPRRGGVGVGALRRRRRRGDRRARRRGLRQGARPSSLSSWWRRGRDGGQANCPTAPRPRSCTATISWC